LDGINTAKEHQKEILGQNALTTLLELITIKLCTRFDMKFDIEDSSHKARQREGYNILSSTITASTEAGLTYHTNVYHEHKSLV